LASSLHSKTTTFWHVWSLFHSRFAKLRPAGKLKSEPGPQETAIQFLFPAAAV
jgi:hypothetical protein